VEGPSLKIKVLGGVYPTQPVALAGIQKMPASFCMEET
jgi:hypothetical protein